MFVDCLVLDHQILEFRAAAQAKIFIGVQDPNQPLPMKLQHKSHEDHESRREMDVSNPVSVELYAASPLDRLF